jgi:hypothetical protein
MALPSSPSRRLKSCSNQPTPQRPPPAVSSVGSSTSLHDIEQPVLLHDAAHRSAPGPSA